MARAKQTTAIARCAGFSLVELVVAMALSALLISGLIKLAASVYQIFCLQNAIASMQERGRFAMSYLHRQISGHDYQQFNRMVYFVGDTHRKDRHRPILALYQRRLGGRREELIDYVSRLRLRYGVLLADGNFVYLPDRQISHWQRVKSVEIKLALSSENNLLPIKTWYSYAALRAQ